MAFTNFDTKEINCKVIYFGPHGSGKTENLRSVYSNTSAEVRSGLLELEDSEGATQFFDFLPISMGYVKDFHLKLHLFTLPTNSLYESVSSVILKGIDGFVFVADSRVESMVNNVESLTNAKRFLTEEGYNVAEMPKVFQYNKRDLSDLLPVDVLRAELNPGGVADHEAVATDSIGTMETLQTLAKSVINKISSSH